MTTEAAIGYWWFVIHRIQRSSLKGQNPIIDSIPTKPMSVKNTKKSVSLQPLAAVALWQPLWDSLLFFLPRWGQLTSHRNVPWMSQRVGSSSSPTCHGPRARQMNIWMRWKFRDGKAKWWIPHWCVFYMCWPKPSGCQDAHFFRNVYLLHKEAWPRMKLWHPNNEKSRLGTAHLQPSKKECNRWLLQAGTRTCITR